MPAVCPRSFEFVRSLLHKKQPFAYAAGGKGGPPPLHPRPGDIAPWNAKMMRSHVECQARMALVC